MSLLQGYRKQKTTTNYRSLFDITAKVEILARCPLEDLKPTMNEWTRLIEEELYKLCDSFELTKESVHVLVGGRTATPW